MYVPEQYLLEDVAHIIDLLERPVTLKAVVIPAEFTLNKDWLVSTYLDRAIIHELSDSYILPWIEDHLTAHATSWKAHHPKISLTLL